MGRDYVSEMLPLADILFIPLMIYEYGERRWNDIDKGKQKYSEKNLSQCHFLHHKLTRARTRDSVARSRRLTA
jgi:hypothetical protein